MHILEIPSIFLPRGGRFCLDQAKALASHGHEVRILSCVEIGITEMPIMYMMLPYGTKWVANEGIETLQFYSRRIPKYTRLNNRRWLKKVCSMFNTYVKRYGKPDVIHVHSVHWAGYAAFLIKKQWNVPYVITEHSSRAIFEMEFGKGVTDSWQIPLLKEALKNMKLYPSAAFANGRYTLREPVSRYADFHVPSEVKTIGLRQNGVSVIFFFVLSALTI